MKDINLILERCYKLGAILIPSVDRIKIQAPNPLPDDLLAEMKEAKPQILAELRKQSKENHEKWILEEWRQLSIPDWRRILQKSIEKKDANREKYALWMLREVLEDPDYRE